MLQLEKTLVSNLRALLTAVILIAVAGVSAAVDLKQIEVDVQMNPARYRALLERYEQGDTTLTVPEMSTVYYGYSYTADYDPRESFADIETALESEDYETAEYLASEALKLNPVSFDLNVLMLEAVDRQREKGNYGRKILLYGIRCDNIATAILESGRGTIAASPFRVISSGDMRRILTNVLGIDKVVDRTSVGEVDAIKVVFPKSDRQHILYFDNTREKEFLTHNK